MRRTAGMHPECPLEGTAPSPPPKPEGDSSYAKDLVDVDEVAMGVGVAVCAADAARRRRKGGLAAKVARSDEDKGCAAVHVRGPNRESSEARVPARRSYGLHPRNHQSLIRGIRRIPVPVLQCDRIVRGQRHDFDGSRSPNGECAGYRLPCVRRRTPPGDPGKEEDIHFFSRGL